ncbi:hypothetical protein JRO89_XS09G0111500 [Xanthoceras sorbifolium]|uniref:DUF4220 domain-containing protein n=1 Tax=Xanthoceras sorbifolium TaxID=99658 RepID=A0ABQ8HL75_9ROSI|nr:hypothetical protein JRO89_XS09G0111500 [Xanthoceras sorbifolium]
MSAMKAFKVIEIELGFMYDVLFTKATIVSLEKWLHLTWTDHYNQSRDEMLAQRGAFVLARNDITNEHKAREALVKEPQLVHTTAVVGRRMGEFEPLLKYGCRLYR